MDNANMAKDKKNHPRDLCFALDAMYKRLLLCCFRAFFWSIHRCHHGFGEIASYYHVLNSYAYKIQVMLLCADKPEKAIRFPQA